VKTDAFGFTHPEPQDTPTLIGSLHIQECGPCRQTFGDAIGPEFLDTIDKLAEAFQREERAAARHVRTNTNEGAS
jgi:hypothetical protein